MVVFDDVPFHRLIKLLKDVFPSRVLSFVLPIDSSCSFWSLTRKDKAEDDGVGGKSVLCL
jgi:hypothetical protein